MRIQKKLEFKDIRILLLDDKKEFILMLKDILNGDGYDCIETNDPEEAVEILKQGNIDILIIDYLMVGLTAVQVIEEVRRFNNDVYIILLTAHGELMTEVFAIENYDIQAYSEKGAELKDLRLKVKIACKQIKKYIKDKHTWDGKTLGERLKYCRNKSHMTQEVVAQYLNVQRTTVANYESDRNEPSLVQIRKLKKLFGVTYEYLLNDEDDCINKT